LGWVLASPYIPGQKFPACIWLCKEDLVDDNVVGVNAELGEFLNKPLSFIQTEKLRDADADERRQVRVLELLVDLWRGVE
jgi:hypothetical protein